jgi:hypothetical protein
LTNLDIIDNDQYVLVASGMKIKVNGVGEFTIFSNKIKDILYINTFSMKLISMSKLTKELNCDVFFF